MFFALSKILAFLTMPTTWMLLALVMSFFWKKQSKKLRWAAVVIFLFFSNGFILLLVNKWWEPSITPDSKIENSDVAVILGGYASYDTASARVIFGNTADRFLQGYRLYENGRVKKLLISGGSGYLLEPELREGAFVHDFLRDINVPEGDILLDTSSRNTRENAINSAILIEANNLQHKPIVLVTSAYHMRRALACLKKQGLDVIPYPTDPMKEDQPWTLDFLLLPNASVLAHWNVLIHEWLGYMSYRILGYL